MQFVRWEPRLRAMFHGRPIFDPEHAELRNLDGTPLDPSHAFREGDPSEEMAHFLRTTGYLLVRGVFSAAEIESFLEHAERLRREAKRGDKQSWWGKNRKGESVLCRVIDAGRIPELLMLYRDPRLLRLVALADADLSPELREAQSAVTVLWKNPDMCEGLSDLPWHRDCGMGGHAVMCPVLICTINLTPGTAQAGQLRMLPGSWQSSFPFFEATDPQAPRGVPLDTEVGDVSLHYGDVMHASPPPTGDGPYRVSVLLGFTPPGAHHHRGEAHYNDVLLSRDDGQIEHLQQVADRTNQS